MSNFNENDEIYYFNRNKCGKETTNRPCGYYPAKYVRYSEATKSHVINFL